MVKWVQLTQQGRTMSSRKGQRWTGFCCSRDEQLRMNTVAAVCILKVVKMIAYTTSMDFSSTLIGNQSLHIAGGGQIV